MRHPYHAECIQLPLPSERAMAGRYRPRLILTALTVTAAALVVAALL